MMRMQQLLGSYARCNVRGGLRGGHVSYSPRPACRQPHRVLRGIHTTHNPPAGICSLPHQPHTLLRHVRWWLPKTQHRRRPRGLQVGLLLHPYSSTSH